MYPQVRVMNCRKGIGEEGRREEGKGEREERGERGREGREKKERRERSEDNRMGGEREKIKVCMECSDHSPCYWAQGSLEGQNSGHNSCRAVHLNLHL